MNSIQNGLCALFAVFLGLAILMVILRLWARWIKRVSLQLNDYACVIALVSYKSRCLGRETSIYGPCRFLALLRSG